MRDYEIMIIIKPPADEDAVEGFHSRIEQLITDQGGEVVEVNRWGKRRLAYEIDDIREGFYFVIDFKGTTQVTGELDRILKINDEVLRHMIIAKNE